MLVNTLLKRHDQFVALIFVWLQAKTLFPLIMAICYFGELSACPDMSDHNQQKLHNQFIASINVWLYIKYHNNHSTLSRYIDNFLFQSTLRITGHKWQHPHIIIITQLFPEILTICYSKALLACLGIGDKTQMKWHISTDAKVIINDYILNEKFTVFLIL